MIQVGTNNETRKLHPDVSLRSIAHSDLREVTNVHLDSFPQSALSRLGRSIVERYYRWQLEGPHKKVHAVGAFRGDGKCVGFSFSGVFNGSTSGFLKRNRGYLAGMVMLQPWLLFNPLFFDRVRSGVTLLLANGKKKESSPAGGDENPKPRSFGILSIAVARDYQQYGIGKILMADAEREAVEFDYPQMHLTVSPDNTKAVRFYERLGWIRKEDKGNWRGLMVKPLPAKSTSANAGMSTE